PVYAIYPWVPEDAPSLRQRDRALFAATARGDNKPAGGIFPAHGHSLAAQTFPQKKLQTDALRTRRLDQVRMAWVGLILLAFLGGYLSLFTFFHARYVFLATGIGTVIVSCFVLMALAFNATLNDSFSGVKSKAEAPAAGMAVRDGKGAAKLQPPPPPLPR